MCLHIERRKNKREGSGAMSLCQLRWGGRVGPKKDDNKKEWASLLIEILVFNPTNARSIQLDLGNFDTYE
jgi:hypothetical protein